MRTCLGWGVVVSWLFFVTGGLAVAGMGASRAEPLAGGFLSALHEKDYRRAASYFHYPEGFTATERKRDLESVADALCASLSEFGPILKIRQNRRWESVVGMTVAGGTPAYWKERPVAARSAFEAVYARHPRGFLVLSFFATENGLKIRSVEFGLKKGHPEAVKAVRRILDAIGRRKGRFV